MVKPINNNNCNQGYARLGKTTSSLKNREISDSEIYYNNQELLYNIQRIAFWDEIATI